MLVWRKFREDDLKQIKTCGSFSGLYVRVYILIPVHVFVLLIKKSYCIQRVLYNVYIEDVGKRVDIYKSIF